MSDADILGDTEKKPFKYTGGSANYYGGGNATANGLDYI